MLQALLSDDVRRDPYPHYDRLRATTPVLHDDATGRWLVFEYDTVKRVLSDYDAFSAQHGPDWMGFTDPPRHTQLRTLISQAFTPPSIALLEPRIETLVEELLAPVRDGEPFDLAADFSGPLPMMVIAEMLGVPPGDRSPLKRWSDILLAMSYTIAGGPGTEKLTNDFLAATAEMDAFVATMLDARRSHPEPDLFTRLNEARVDGQRLTRSEILGFFQLLLLAGSETTTNLINNAVLCLLEHPAALAELRANPERLPAAIEEVLRYRSPLQWMYRIATRDIELSGQPIPAGKMVLAVIGSANRDPKHFPDADRFDIHRDPNPHIAFGHGVHFCLGAGLARLEARIALTALLKRPDWSLASNEPWPPRAGLQVLGPSALPFRFGS